MSYELRRRIAVTVASLVAARLLLHVPVPFVDLEAWRTLTDPGAAVGYFPDTVRRGALGGLRLLPYLTASVISCTFVALRRGGPAASGPREAHVVLLALAIALMQGFAYVVFLEKAEAPAAMRLATASGALFRVSTIVSLMAGMMALIGLARLITSRGIVTAWP